MAQTATPPARFSLVGASDCANFPEIATNTVGTPLRGPSPTAPVRGFLDAHTHVSAFRSLGGRFHCGRPWSPYGVTVALRDCVDHQGNGAGAVAENSFTTGAPVGSHSTGGWPTFDGWPRPESLTHEGTYWRWIERAWRGGLRIMVNDLGVEVSEVLDCGRRTAGSPTAPTCTAASIRAQLDELHGLGARSLFPVHKFDNGLGGTHFDNGGTGLLVNTGNEYATGEWWNAPACPPGTAESDNTPTNLTSGAPEEGDDTSQRRLQALGGVVSPYAEMSRDYVETWRTARRLAPASGLPGIGYGTDTNGLGAQASVRPDGTTVTPVRYPDRTFDGGTTMYRQVSGSRTYDVNTDGAAHYGLFPDWVEDLRRIEGQDIVDDLANGAEAYLQMWAAAQP